ncbi:MAG: hypothetical protein PHP31_07270 [Lentimicrobiaceae bacterium]|nr:hypothetical protein [Lentimicrobiaceae bacterium]
MKDLKLGITLIVLGNVLYVSKDFFTNILPTAFGDFTQGFLLGCGVGLNVIGIILVFVYLAKAEKKQ